ncbi:MAG: C39 family peptidase [Candidatus Heimdallarchaeota archaeon]|nr:C39 family peptidase [Candidatus Heimdallarchaeota archaeon]MDH5647261.1 C39 family peptidase [Candidatus Heimdallarchaeota archaeon]
MQNELIKVPLVRQSTNYTCGVAALQSVLGYYGYEKREDLLAKLVKCSSETGTPNWEMVNFAKSIDFDAFSTTDFGISNLEKTIDEGIPVIVAIQAWIEDKTKDWKEIWDSGHYVVTIGYDMDKFYFMDPSTLGRYTFIPRDEFIDRWHDIDQNNNIVNQLAVVIKNKHPYSIVSPNQFSKIE